jgi:hypothetical protein
VLFNYFKITHQINVGKSVAKVRHIGQIIKYLCKTGIFIVWFWVQKQRLKAINEVFEPIKKNRVSSPKSLTLTLTLRKR